MTAVLFSVLLTMAVFSGFLAVLGTVQANNIDGISTVAKEDITIDGDQTDSADDGIYNLNIDIFYDGQRDGALAEQTLIAVYQVDDSGNETKIYSAAGDSAGIEDVAAGDYKVVVQPAFSDTNQEETTVTVDGDRTHNLEFDYDTSGDTPTLSSYDKTTQQVTGGTAAAVNQTEVFAGIAITSFLFLALVWIGSRARN